MMRSSIYIDICIPEKSLCFGTNLSMVFPSGFNARESYDQL